MPSPLDRRQFLAASALAGAGLLRSVGIEAEPGGPAVKLCTRARRCASRPDEVS